MVIFGYFLGRKPFKVNNNSDDSYENFSGVGSTIGSLSGSLNYTFVSLKSILKHFIYNGIGNKISENLQE